MNPTKSQMKLSQHLATMQPEKNENPNAFLMDFLRMDSSTGTSVEGGRWHAPGIMRVLLLFVFTGAQPTIRAETQTKQTAPKEKLNIL